MPLASASAILSGAVLAHGAPMLAAALVVLWLAQLLLALRVVRTVPPTSKLPNQTLDRWPRLTMIVPARDEAAGIEAALRSKLDCGYPELEIVAVDDRSRDDTGAILDRIASSDPRVRVVHLDALPEGWLGKLHAMKRGLDLASGEWVLFSDADVHVEPGTIERLIAFAETEGVDFIAVFPRMRPTSLVIDSIIAALLRVLVLTGRVWSANDDRSHVGVGVGAFNLARRRILESTRAVEELRMEVADDVALASLLKQSGARCRFFAGRADVHMVFLDSLGAAARSVDKGGGMLGWSLWRPLLVVALALSLDLVLPITALFFDATTAAFGLAALLLATLTHVVINVHLANPLLGAFLWPIGHLVNMVLTVRSAVRAWRNQGVYWRDTFYPRQVVERGRRIEIPSLRVTVRPSPP